MKKRPNQFFQMLITTSCSPHADPLVRAPGPDHPDVGIHALHANVGALPARGRVRPTDDLILAGLVDNAIAELEAIGRIRLVAGAAGFFSGFGLAIGPPQRIARRAHF